MFVDYKNNYVNTFRTLRAHQKVMMGFYEKLNINLNFSDEDEEKLTEEEKIELTLKYRENLIYDSMIKKYIRGNHR